MEKGRGGVKKLPRNISGKELIKLLGKYGYKEVGQKGSHIRVESEMMGKKHRIVIPDHKSLKVGTLNNILKEVSRYLGISKEELISELFGN